ncbi:MAG: Ppx/GppA family phosphatase [Gammaproteobacteria bacterium]|nr:Ppx/GppA family phosphatase [Gammaproteobacteria bacterium]NNM14356.1 Ppx/GppA family phosphatase [Gammaproteobacteria bacterium]
MTAQLINDPKPEISTQLMPGDVLAAVDLGSNSFHMIIARYEGERLHIIDKMRESIRLGAGLDEKHNLTEIVMVRALQCLQRFGQRLREFDAQRVRVVGTNTLRRARNSQVFIQQAQQALGQEIEIISGVEEARLIYTGVSHFAPHYAGQRIVIDIGGGSTEIIYGINDAPQIMESTSVGCVYLSQLYFSDGKISTKRMHKAITHAKREFEPIYLQFTKRGWDHVIGASGTARAAIGLVQDFGWSVNGMSAESLQQLIDKIVSFGHIDNIDLPDLSNDRAAILPAGLAILIAFFDLFNVKVMRYADGALREGLLYDHWDRLQNRDIRYLTINALKNQYLVDIEQARRVRSSALNFLSQVAADWDLEDLRFQRLLHWGAELYEVGLSLSHTQYHKHSQYIVANADMAGFSRGGQEVLAHLVGYHRRRIPDLDSFPPSLDPRSQFYALVLFRLATLLHRSRQQSALPEIKLAVSENKMTVTFPEKWLAQRALTESDLEQEQNYLADHMFQLKIKTI